MRHLADVAATVALAVLILLAASSTTRPAPQPTGPAPSDAGPDAPPLAIATTSATASATAPTWSPTASRSERPVANGSVTPAPTSTARSGVGRPVRFYRGQATYWDSLGAGWYVAVRPDLGIRVGSVIQVCNAHAQDCRAAPVVTTCGCLGPNSGRIVDLSLDLFAHYADPKLGVVQVVLEVTS